MRNKIFVSLIVIGSTLMIGGWFFDYYYQLKIDKVKATNNSAVSITKGEASKTIMSKEFSDLKIIKTPVSATKWLLRIDCPTDVNVMLQSKETGWVYCNKEVALDAYPSLKDATSIVFQMTAVNPTSGEQFAKIVARTLDSNGAQLKEDILSLTISANIDDFIEKKISYASVKADGYFNEHQQGGYEGFCTYPEGITDVKNELVAVSSSVVCKDSKIAWAMSAQIKGDSSKYLCSDSHIGYGKVVSRPSPVTTTSCE